MHFKHLVALILREFVGQKLGKNTSEINPGDILWYVNTLRNDYERGNVADTVKCIFFILFQRPSLSSELSDYVDCWIRRTNPLLSMLFDDYKCIDQKFKFDEKYFYPYNIKRNGWRLRSTDEDVFNPTDATLNEIKSVLHNYNNPLHPVDTNVRRCRRAAEPMYGWLSPPRRRRRQEMCENVDIRKLPDATASF
jgi:hypothetical protein